MRIYWCMLELATISATQCAALKTTGHSTRYKDIPVVTEMQSGVDNCILTVMLLLSKLDLT